MSTEMEQTEVTSGPPLVIESVYDHPKYYDLLFGSDCQAELAFLEGCFERYTDRTVERLFEPGCGTGRLLIHFARAGYTVSGNDLNAMAIDYCNDRLERNGFARSCVVGDMSDFCLADLPNRTLADAAFNTINTFRHLSSDAAAIAHLNCMADVIAPGGLYAVGIHLLPTRGIRMEEEAWTSRRGHLQVNSFMWSKRIDDRDEVLGMTLDVYTPTSHRRIEDEMRYRTYTADQFDELLSLCPQWEVAATHDFAYDLDNPIEIGPMTEDVVYVLRRI